MEKLIELLNKYEKEIKKSEFYEWEKGIGRDTNLFRRDTRDTEGSHIYSDTADTYVISKKYGFIERLVDNNKIDLDKVEFVDEWATKYQSLLMLLAISDTPIKDLISYLR